MPDRTKVRGSGEICRHCKQNKILVLALLISADNDKD